jgi:hypothetical protein
VDNRISDLALQPIGGGSSVSFPEKLGTANYFILQQQASGKEITFKSGPRAVDALELLGTGHPPSSLHVINNIYPGLLTSNPDYQFKSVSYARHEEFMGTTIMNSFHYFGYPTPVAAIPASGSRSFSTLGLNYDIFTVGTNFGNTNKATSVSTAAVNYTAKTVTFAVTITSNGTSLGTYSGLGTFTAGTNRFSGTLTADGSALSGNFSGSLFGPAGEEVGLAFSLTGTPVISGATGKRTVIGLVLGK